MKMKRKIFGLYLSACALFNQVSSTFAQEPLALNTSYKILSPKFFPGWQAQHVASPFVFYDSAAGHYKMYYSGSSSTQVNESLWDQWVTGMVTSTNMLSWNYPDTYEPVLFARKLMEGEVISFHGGKNRFDAIAAVDVHILKEGPLYKAWYTGWDGSFMNKGDGTSEKIYHRIGYATSTDGQTWTKFPGNFDGAIVATGDPGSADEYGAEDPYVIRENGLYRMWYSGFDGKKRNILYAISEDGINWKKNGVAIHAGSSGEPDEVSVRSPVVIKRRGVYELWYEGHATTFPRVHTLRAVSSDGVNWKKTGEVTLHPSAPQPSWPWTSLSTTGMERTMLGNIIVYPDHSCQVFYATEFTGSRQLTYGEITAPLSYIFTERINP